MLAVKEVLEKDYRNRMTAFLQGGEKRGKIQTAKNMLKKNMDIDLIEEITGLKREEFM